ncbi:hypothetical protein HanRHA438_Chr15g0723971 [Helianthus annuus]|nr:hypothetical protein HanIR_Chr15g0774521 [Helianthus annuus]KAJ0846362.1 hypothetical protein HanRHA438_Chr15g0723971 [Helianthus annuus]
MVVVLSMYPLYTLPNPQLPMTKLSLNSSVAAFISLSEKRRHGFGDLSSSELLFLARLSRQGTIKTEIYNKTKAPPTPPIITAYGDFFLFSFTVGVSFVGVSLVGVVVQRRSGFRLARFLSVLSLKASKPFK